MDRTKMINSTAIRPRTQTGRTGSLEIRLLGCVDFQATKLLQEWQAAQVAKANDCSGVLLLCEHPPCVSRGRTSSIEQLQLDDEHELETRQISVHSTNRAGGTLIHAPGQLAIYLVIPYRRLGLSPSELVATLNHAIRSVIKDLGIEMPADIGQALESIKTAHRKQIANVGVASRENVSFFGAYLNVSPDLSLLRLVKEANGMSGITSLQAERAGLVRMDAVRESVIHHISIGFGYQESHLHTSHPFLKRTTRKVHAYT